MTFYLFILFYLIYLIYCNFFVFVIFDPEGQEYHVVTCELFKTTTTKKLLFLVVVKFPKIRSPETSFFAKFISYLFNIYLPFI